MFLKQLASCFARQSNRMLSKKVAPAMRIMHCSAIHVTVGFLTLVKKELRPFFDCSF